MKPPHQADRYYRIIVAIGGLALLVYGLFRMPQIDIHLGIFLILAISAGILVQYPIKLVRGEVGLVQVVALGGGFIAGPVPTAWAIAFGMAAGYIFRWLVRGKRTWRRLLRINAWIKIGYGIGLISIPLVVTFSLFGFSERILSDPEVAIWTSGLLLTIIFAILHSGLYLGGFILQQHPATYPKLRSDLVSLLAIELLSIPFVLLVVEIYADIGVKSLALLGGAPIIAAYLLNKMNTAQIEHERRVRELSTLNHISQSLRSNLDLDELLPVIQQQVMQLLEVNNIYVALYDRSTKELWYPLAVNHGQRQNWSRRTMADRLTDRVIRAGKAILLTPQTQPTLAPVGLPPSEETPTAWLGVPLISSERTIGCLAVFALKPGKIFTSDDVSVLTILSGQVSVAIENALLYQQTQHRARQLETLNQLTGAIAASLDLKEVLAQVCSSVSQVAGGQRSAVFLLDLNEDTISLAYSHGLNEAFDKRNASFSIANSRRARCLRTGKAMIVSDIKESSLSLDLVQHFQADKIRAFADFPLITPDGQIGILSTYFKSKHDFTHEEVSIIQTFASQAAMAVANARLHARTDAALAHRVNQLTTLEAVGRELSAATHSERLFTLILEYALEMTNSCCGTVAIFNPASQNMVVKAAHGYDVPDDKFPVANGITGRVGRTRATANVGDVSKDSDFLDLRNRDTKSQLSVPIIHENRILGIITLESPELNAYSESEEAFVTQLANQAAIDIVNAELYHETQRRLKEQSILYQASTQLVGAVAPENVANTITKAIDAVIHPLEVGIYNWMDEVQRYSLLGEKGEHLPSEIEGASKLANLSQGAGMNVISKDDPLVNSLSIGCSNCQILTYPLEMAQQRPGLVVLHIAQHRHINPNETELLKTILAQGSIALQNAHNFLEAKNGHDRLAAIINSIEEGILMVDIEGHILLANEPIRMLTGLPLKDILETPIDELPDRVLKTLGYNQTEIKSILSTLRHSQVPISPKTTFELSDSQRTRILEQATSPIWGHDGAVIGLMIVVRDITKQREIEQTRDAITETIVHDLRSPMSAIVGALDLLSDTLAGAEDAVIEQSLLVAQRSANRVLSLTEALLDIARLQSGRMEIDYEEIDVPTLVSELMIEYTALANDDSVIIRNQIPSQLPAVYADLDKLIRIITNLVDNAIKFTPEGGHVTISAKLATEHLIEITVIDSGPGVPPDYREKIFERFVQVPGQRARRRGTGLGLTFCRLTVEAHGGRIWVDANPEGGSIFTFTIATDSPEGESPPQ